MSSEMIQSSFNFPGQSSSLCEICGGDVIAFAGDLDGYMSVRETRKLGRDIFYHEKCKPMHSQKNDSSNPKQIIPRNQ